MDTLDAIIRDLAGRIRQSRHREPDAFPWEAASMIRNSGCVQRLSALDLAGELITSNNVRQIAIENDYGQPAITVLRCEDFRIEFMFWRRGPTVYIHDHIAGGAFAVVQGRRAQSTYRMACLKYDDGSCQIGQIENDTTELLEPGEVIPIVPRDGLIHSLVFIDKVGITLSVRRAFDNNKQNENSLGSAAQSYYLLPSIRLATGDSPSIERYSELLQTIGAVTDPKQMQSLLTEVAKKRNLSFLVALMTTKWAFINPDLRDFLAEVIYKRYPDVMFELSACFDDSFRYTMLTLLADQIGPETALILALLHADAQPNDVLRIVCQVFGPENAQLIIRTALDGVLHLRCDVAGRTYKLLGGDRLLRNYEAVSTVVTP